MIPICRVCVGLFVITLALWYNHMLWALVINFKDGTPLWGIMMISGVFSCMVALVLFIVGGIIYLLHDFIKGLGF